ncbi:hypothetical protein NS226_12225 [Aureimonas ureilytica]|uniref:Uncharacterized protein n=1 Tax=Aureimonas ureilytica TaxID=401562 RepID=A0A175R816_9HYPH|nr:hypothetical protein NS226_12225 [Aureimonas ureilytica]
MGRTRLEGIAAKTAHIEDRSHPIAERGCAPHQRVILVGQTKFEKAFHAFQFQSDCGRVARALAPFERIVDEIEEDRRQRARASTARSWARVDAMQMSPSSAGGLP